ncbi:MAG: hypothetical protein ACE5ID_02905 [Acidobacteriota bacterium]
MRPRHLPLIWMVPITAVLAAAGFLTGNRFLFPLLAMAPAYPVMVDLLLQGRRGRAVAAMLIWAASLSVTSVGLCLWFPDHAAATVWNGPAYAGEMFRWLATGVGTESEPSRFLIQLALHAALFVVLSLATASLASLYLGTLMVNYMAYYVASVIHAASGAPLAVAMAWHPWSVIRMGAFVVLGVVLAEPLLGIVQRGKQTAAGRGFWIGVALAGLVMDAVLKAALAPWWRIWLQRLVRAGELHSAGGGRW